MNILYINHYAGAPQYGMEIRPYELAKRWVKEGCNVRIIAAKNSHIRAKNPSINKECIDGVEYFWMNTPEYKKNNVWRFCNILVFLFRLYKNRKKYLENFTPDVVIASSTYPMDIFPARKIAKKYNAKLVFELHDLWPLSLYALGAFTPKNIFAKWVQYAEDYYCKHADRVVSILPKTKTYLQSRGMDADKWYCVPNGINIKREMLSNFTFKSEIEKIKDEYDYVIGYVGSINTANNLEFFITAIQDKSIALVLIGTGADEDRIRNIISTNKLSNIYLLGKVSPNEVLSALSFFDFLYKGTYRKNLYKYGISPIKLCEYMLSAKPIIHVIQQDTNDIVKEALCGLSLPPDNPEKLVEAIQALQSMTEEERKAMGQRGKEHVIANYDYDVLAQNFLEVIK